MKFWKACKPYLLFKLMAYVLASVFKLNRLLASADCSGIAWLLSPCATIFSHSPSISFLTKTHINHHLLPQTLESKYGVHGQGRQGNIAHVSFKSPSVELSMVMKN